MPKFHYIESNHERFRPASTAANNHTALLIAGLSTPFASLLTLKPPRNDVPVRLQFHAVPTFGCRVLTIHARSPGAGWQISVSVRRRNGWLSKRATLRVEPRAVVGCKVILPRFWRAIDLEVICTCTDTPATEPLCLKLGLMQLTQIGLLADRFDTDKGYVRSWNVNHGPHAYAVAYEEVLGPQRANPLTLLEIGLHTPSTTSGVPDDAPSLRMWRLYLPRSRIFGLDKNDFSQVTVEGASIVQADQSKPNELLAAVQATGASHFDIIIDDGSHASSHQQISLATLFPKVRPGGWYVIEDLCWQPFPEEPRTLDMLTSFGRAGRAETPLVSRQACEMLEREVSEIRIYKPNCCEIAFIRRRFDLN